MTKAPFSRHCERFAESRGNLRLCGGTFSTGPRLRKTGYFTDLIIAKMAREALSKQKKRPGSNKSDSSRQFHFYGIAEFFP
jgi:hypothetical protein